MRVLADLSAKPKTLFAQSQCKFRKTATKLLVRNIVAQVGTSGRLVTQGQLGTRAREVLKKVERYLLHHYCPLLIAQMRYSAFQGSWKPDSKCNKGYRVREDT